MTRETKVGLLFGMALILVIGILVSDFLVEPPNPAAMTDFAGRAQPTDLAGRTVRVPETVAPTGRREVSFPLPPINNGDSDVIDQPMVRTNNPPPRAVASTGHTPTIDEVIDRGESFRRRRPAADDGFFHPADPAPVNTAADYAAAAESRNNRFVIDERPVDIRPLPQQQPQPVDTTPAPTSRDTWHTVGRNESLYQIARRYYNNGEQWRTIQQANPTRVDANGRVREGVRLLIPAPVDLASLPQFERVDARAAADALPPARPADTATASIVVQPGQTLSDLAAEYLGSSRRWPELLEANRDQLTTDRDLRAGMELRLPRSANAPVARNHNAPAPGNVATRTYTVRDNDNLYRIAASQLGDGNRWRDILKLNSDQINNENEIRPGMTLKLPNR